MFVGGSIKETLQLINKSASSAEGITDFTFS
ncbi:MAG: hypothetical protein ACI82Z_001807 [Cellvibrionaceae bacterium]|jgi:hypothetical protein